MHIQPSPMKRGMSAAPIITINLMAALAAILAALFLRLPLVSAIRDPITHALTPEGRAMVEHLLSGYGCTVGATMLFLVFYLVAMGKQGPIPSNGSAYTRFRQGQLRWIDWLFSREVRVAAIWGLIYLCGTVGWWEVRQAYFGENGLSPRHYLQYGQIASDFLGVALGVLYTLMVPVHANRLN